MSGTMDSATQTSDVGSDDEHELTAFEKMSPRVVIDTSAPFGSVEEAVMRFGGRGFWVPDAPPFLHDLAASPHRLNESEEPDIKKLEDRAAAMLNDLQMKEQETLEILKELDLTKRLVEELKLKLPKEVPEHNVKTSDPIDPSSTILMELKQAKLNLFQNTNELSAIRASVESLSKTMEREKETVDRARETPLRNDGFKPLAISRELRELNYEAEQFMKTAEAAKSEVLRAMSEIEQTKAGLRVIEMRWVAARKLKEAARATESLALAEIRALNERDRRASNLQKCPRRDQRLLDANEFPFARDEGKPVLRPSTSIGDILSRKLVLRDDLGVDREKEGRVGRRERVSLNQMLRQQRGEVERERSPMNRREKEGGSGGEREGKGFFSRRKGLRFVHISLPVPKHSKNKIQALNLW